jgi:hypothetical protein
MQNLEQLQQDAPILKKSVDLYKEFYAYLKEFPKKDQYMLGKRCEEYMLVFLESVFSAAGLPKEQKLSVLFKASAKLDTLKILFRMACELRMLDNKQYLSIQLKIQDIGKMLGGWIKSLYEKRPNS